jgi:hypothetical protein
VLISPTNLCNAQGCQHKVNGVKGAVLFLHQASSYFTAYFRLQLLHRVPYFGKILPNAVAIKKHQQLHVQKLHCFGTKNDDEIDPPALVLDVLCTYQKIAELFMSQQRLELEEK